MTGDDANGTGGPGSGEGLTRRGTLRLGAAAVAAGSGLSGVGPAAAAEYDRVTVSSGETFSRALGDGDTLENLLIDASAADALVDIKAVGSGWTIRNVGVLGPTAFDRTDGTAGVIRGYVDDPDGTGRIENVYVERTHDNFLFVNNSHAGHLTVRNSTFVGRDEKEDVLYGSPPGNPDIDWDGYKNPGADGTIRVEGCHAENVADYGWRLGSDGSELVDSTVVGAEVGVANLWGQPVTLRNVDIVDCDKGVRLGSHLTDFDFHDRLEVPPRTVVENVRIDANTPVQRFEYTDGEPVVDGSFSVGEADPTPPATAPSTAEAAARGEPTLDRRITLESASGRTDYRIEVSGGITRGDRATPSDEVSGSIAEGSVWESGLDSYRFAGSVERVAVTGGDPADLVIRVDGEPVLDRTLSLAGTGSEASYEFAVDGRLQPAGNSEHDDVVDGPVATGTVADGTARFRFDGELLYLRHDGDLDVRADGTAATPDDYPSHPRTLTLDGDGDRADYRVTASRGIAPSAEGSVSRGMLPGNDGDSVDAGVWGGTDAYAFGGALTDLQVDFDRVDVRVDGEPVAPGRFGDLERTVAVDGSGLDEAASYSVTVDGAIRGTGTVNAGDRVAADGTRAEGAVLGGTDRYRFSGSITGLSVPDGVRLLVDGQERTPEDVLGPDLEHTLSVSKAADDLPDGEVTYSLSVSDALAATDDVEAGGSDTVGDTTASGGMGPAGGVDTYRFAGTIESFDLDGAANVFVDGERVPPAWVVGAPDDLSDGAAEGSLPAGGLARYRYATDADRVRITLDADADHDLLVTVDGRPPRRDDTDRASRSAGSTEEIVLEDVDRIGVAVSAVEAGAFSLSVTEETVTRPNTIAVSKAADDLPDGEVTYSLSVSDALAATDDVEAGGSDTVGDASASGGMGPAGGVDTYRFAGTIDGFELSGAADVFVNGRWTAPDNAVGQPDGDDHLPHTLVVDGGDGGLAAYELAVSGSIRRDDDASETTSVFGDFDSTGDGGASGTVVGGRDVYRFSGEVTERSVRGDATVRVRRQR